MTKLNQIIAIEKDVRSKAARSLDQANDDVVKGVLLTGLSRTYRPRTEDGATLPPESTRVQLTVNDTTARLAAALGRLWDVTATKDRANTEARADVVVDGEVLLADVPSPFLVWFEKQLAELRGFLARLPVLDPAEVWAYDETTAVYRSEPVTTVRSRKVPKNHVRYEATKEHPAQVDLFTVDEPEGDWTITKFSGAIPEGRRLVLLERVDALIEAVKFAREEANGHTVTDESVGAVVFGYLLA